MRVLSATESNEGKEVNQKASGQVSEHKWFSKLCKHRGKNTPGRGTSKHQNIPVLAKAYQCQWINEHKSLEKYADMSI